MTHVEVHVAVAQELVDGPFADPLRAVLFFDPDRIKVGHLRVAIEFATPHTTSTRDDVTLDLAFARKEGRGEIRQLACAAGRNVKMSGSRRSLGLPGAVASREWSSSTATKSYSASSTISSRSIRKRRILPTTSLRGPQMSTRYGWFEKRKAQRKL